MVHVCVSVARDGLDSVTGPIVVGTSYKLLQALRQTTETSSLLMNLDFVVLDEVDRLLPVAGRYARSSERKTIEERINPTVELMTYILQLSNHDAESNILPFQVVAASATVGRPLRRELQSLFQPRNVAAKQWPRPTQIQAKGRMSDSSRLGDGDDEGKNDFHVIRPVENGSSTAATRLVGIPAAISHLAVLDSQESTELSSKLAIAKKLWVERRDKRSESGQVSRGLLFVPSSADVSQALGILRFWGVSEAVNLLQTLGIDGSGIGEEDEEETTDRPVGVKAAKISRPSTSELLSRAGRSGLGSSYSQRGFIRIQISRCFFNPFPYQMTARAITIVSYPAISL